MNRASRSSPRFQRLLSTALIASLFFFAVFAKVVLYLPDPGHEISLTVAKISTTGQKSTPLKPTFIATAGPVVQVSANCGDRRDPRRLPDLAVNFAISIELEADTVRPPPAFLA